MAYYEIYLDDQLGNRFTLLDSFSALRWQRTVNDVGFCTFSIAANLWDTNWFAKDNRVEIWRAADASSALTLEMVGFMRRKRQTMNGALETVEITALDQNYLLTSRVVNPPTSQIGTRYAADNLDDVMKAIVTAALGSGAGTRAITSYGFSVEADTSAGPSVAVKGSANLKVLLTALRDIHAKSRIAGTPTYFDVVPASPSTLEFRTFINQRGSDRTFGSTNNPNIVSVENETLRNPVLVQDYTDELTYVYARSSQTGQMAERSDSIRNAETGFSRRELFLWSREGGDALTTLADAEVQRGMPTVQFSGELVDGGDWKYGVDWGLGDRVTVNYGGKQMDVELMTVRAEVDSNGKEELSAEMALEDPPA